MASMLPVAVYGLKVPAGDVMMDATSDFPATFRITMAAIDPSAKPEHTGTTNGDRPPRATLKMVYDPSGPKDNGSEDSEEEDDYLQSLLDGRESDGLSDEDDEDESSEDETNGGPSDPSKSKKARKEAAAQELLKALADQNGENDSDDDVDKDESPKVNGIEKSTTASKGKGKAKTATDDEDVLDDEGSSMDGMEEVVICTLDPEKTYQQTIDITIPENQQTYFKVSGTHAIYLTGNYVIPTNDEHNHDDEDYEEDGDYDLSPDEDELEAGADDESDALDDLEDPRITEVDSEDEKVAPQLVKKEDQKEQQPVKGKNKRPAEDSEEEGTKAANLDDIMAKALKPEEPKKEDQPRLSKKQLKKLKNNAGKAVEAAAENKDVKKEDTASKIDKKVQFAKNLEQGPASSPPTVKADTNGDTKKDGEKPKASLGVKMVQGVKIDDKKLGKGPAAKKGDKVGMRYIGKTSDGKVFDANKKGTPFRFRLGAGEVIKGWDIGVAGMSATGERRLVIPASLAYGSKGQPGIPPNSELTFDIRMLEVN